MGQDSTTIRKSHAIYAKSLVMVKFLLSGLIFLLSLVLIGQNLDKPFWGEHDWNGVRYGNIARNYVRYGLWETRFGQVENSGIARVEEFEYYTHYPPLLPILIALSYKIFGISEWSTRVVPLLATSGIIVMIFLISTFVWNIRTAILVSLLALATPATLYFGKNPVHESVVLFFILLSFWGYLRYRQTKQKLFQALFLIGLILAQMTTWVGFFLLPSLTISLLLRKEVAQLKKLWPYWGLSILMFFGHFGHVAILTHSPFGGNLIGSFLQRSGILSNVQPEEFGLLAYADRLRLWFSTLYTITLISLSILWLLLHKADVKNDSWPIFSLGLVGLIYVILFPNSVFIHNYLIFYFLPFICLSGAAGIIYLMRKIQALQNWRLILPILLLVLVFFERKSYLDALNESDSDKLAVEVGQAINDQTTETDVVLVSPLKFSFSADKFLRFYSDRRLIYSDKLSLDYDVLVLINQTEGKFEIIEK